MPGAADDSYGIEVAGLAGVDESVVRRAKAVLKSLESSGGERAPRAAVSGGEDAQISLLDVGGSEIAEVLRNTDLNTMTPIEAMNLLFELKKKV